MQTKLTSAVRLLLVAVFMLAGVHAGDDDNHYAQHNLVSDIQGMADRTDANLVNPWGITRPGGGPWWVNDNGTGVSEVFDAAGNPFPANTPLVVTVPPGPTGIVFNNTADFQLGGKPAAFIFVAEDGSVSAWNGGTSATVEVPASDANIYKGVAIGQNGGANYLFAANFHAGTMDIFDTNFSKVSFGSSAFLDGTLPAGYAPFNVQNINGSLFVAFAKQDEDAEDELHGRGLGFVDVFDTAGNLQMRLEHGPWMNAPWGITMAPAGFGKFSNRLLVGNFGSGTIAGFDPKSGKFRGFIHGRQGPLKIDGLWGIAFGNGGLAGPTTTLFFAAGIQDEAHGLFGTITPKAQGKHKGRDDGHDDDSEKGDDR
jgi:uncharacterized protein (TIGR03118 family)